jgi:hypothetical protein
MDGRTPRSFDNQDDSLLTEVTLLGDHQIRFVICIYVIGSFLKNRIIAYENYRRVHYAYPQQSEHVTSHHRVQ